MNLGELIAKYELEKRGYKVIKTNLRIDHLEIDILTYKNGRLKTWEVRMRTSYTYNRSDIRSFLTNLKAKRLLKATYKLESKIKHPLSIGLILISRIKRKDRTLYIVDLLPDPW